MICVPKRHPPAAPTRPHRPGHSRPDHHEPGHPPGHRPSRTEHPGTTVPSPRRGNSPDGGRGRSTNDSRQTHSPGRPRRPDARLPHRRRGPGPARQALPVRRPRTERLRLLRTVRFRLPPGAPVPAPDRQRPVPRGQADLPLRGAPRRPGVLGTGQPRLPRRHLRRQRPRVARAQARQPGETGPMFNPGEVHFGRIGL